MRTSQYTWPLSAAGLYFAEIERRGSTKTFHDVVGLADTQFNGVVEFDADESFPDASSRWLGALPDPSDQRSAI